MMFVVEHWRWFATGFFLLLLIGVVMNPFAALKVVDEIGGFILDKIEAAFEWARKPHDWTKIGCIWLGIAFAAAAFVAWDARQTIIVVKQQCDAKVLALKTECAAVESQSRSIVQQTNAEAAKQVARALRDARDERDAKNAAIAEASRLKGEASDFDQRMRDARKHPDCNTLLNTDVAKVCGL